MCISNVYILTSRVYFVFFSVCVQVHQGHILLTLFNGNEAMDKVLHHVF